MRLGLIADTQLQLDDLKSLVAKAGFDIGVAFQTGGTEPNDVPVVDAWVVRSGPGSEQNASYIDSLGLLDVPVIFDEVETISSMASEERMRRFVSKLEQCSSEAAPDVAREKAKEVWVLAASAGGPEAVARFLKALPENINGVAFVYVQHIDARMDESLHKAVMQSSHWKVSSCDKTQLVKEKSIYVVSPNHQLNFNEVGLMRPIKEAWVGPYCPSVDQVIARVARNFGKSSGAIIFSGMGNDGALSCKYMKNNGGTIWAQTPSSCTVDSMPVSAIETGSVTFKGTPEKLAEQFNLVRKRIAPYAS